MISRESLLHIPKSNLSYGYDEKTLHIRVRTKKGDAKQVLLKIGDPYIWEKGGADGGNMSAKDAFGWTGSEQVAMIKEAETEYYDYWFTSYQPLKKRSRYAFIIEDDDERILFGERKIVLLTKENTYALNEMSNFFCFPYLNKKDVHKIPSWVKDTVWYQIFPDRFRNADHSLDPVDVEPWGSKPTNHNFMGGDLQGIIDQLDYLKDLGVNGLYLCPIFKASTNHRYDTIDYLEVDTMLGDKKTFKRLVEEAHRRGIKIMLDAVFNHIGHLSKEWQDVVKNNETSEYKDWFYIHKFPVYNTSFDKLDGQNLNYETFGRSKGMPKVNTEHKDVIDYFLKVGTYWVEEFNIDAWRIDVANEVDHSFWRKFREAVHAVNPEVFLLGEIWHDANPWLQGDQFDVAMNYPLTEAIIHYFCTDDIGKNSFIHAVNKVNVSYSKQVTENNFNLLDSHDTSRILTIAGGDVKRIKLAYLFMLSHQGSPCIYYGSELPMSGVKGNGLEDHRSCMTFDHEDQDFYQFMKSLIHLRHAHNEFKSLDNEWINHASNVLAFNKGAITVLMNANPKAAKFDLFKKEKIDVLMKSDKTHIDSKQVSLDPYGYCIFKRSK